jgi:predicted Rossmann-fold nucleotide-binding protein
MDRRSDAFIALPGGIGTLEELLEVWTARTLAMHNKPVVVCDPDDAFAPLRLQIDQIVDRGFARPSIRDSLIWTTTAAAAVDAAEAIPSPSTGAPRPEEVLEAEL